MYKSAHDSESDDKDEVSQEMKKIAREVGDNTNTMNDLSTSTIKHVKEIKSDMKTMSVGVKSDFIFMKEKVDNLESYVDNIAMIAQVPLNKCDMVAMTDGALFNKIGIVAKKESAMPSQIYDNRYDLVAIMDNSISSQAHAKKSIIAATLDSAILAEANSTYMTET